MSDEERSDVIVVGGGLAGLACAFALARAGTQVLVIERGDPPGAKNLSGGRLYLGPLSPLIEDSQLLADAPLERAVTRETLALHAPSSSTTVTLESQRLSNYDLQSHTVLRARFDAWLADKVGEAGGVIVPGTKVDRLLMREDRVCGVVVDDEEIEADVVVAADGALSAMARQAGLRAPLSPSQFVLGIKSLYALDAGVIEDRFSLEPKQGAAELMVGEVTGGLPGGAFLYTNRESLSLGVVIRVDSLRKIGTEGTASSLLERVEKRKEVARRISGGELIEYGAHLVPEIDPRKVGSRVGNGIVVVGDAAGLVINHGLTVRGMDLAIATGILAAQAIIEARAKGDTSTTGLALYDELLQESFVGRDLLRFRDTPRVLSSPWLTRELPIIASELAEDLYSFGAGGKERLSRTTMRHVRKRLLRIRPLGELLRLRRL